MTIPAAFSAVPAKSSNVKAPRLMASTIRGAALLPNTSEANDKASVSLVDCLICSTVPAKPSLRVKPSLA